MAHWFLTAHGNAVNLDQARQIFAKEGRDGLYRVCAEFLISSQTGETISYSLLSGLPTEEDADLMIPRVISGEITDGMAELRQMGRTPDALLEQVGAASSGRQFAGREL
jgi:hypothetical protein